MVEDACDGSLGPAGQRPGPNVQTFLPTALCPVCGNYAEIHPMEPGGAEVWRLEMHDASGTTMRLGPQHNPDADCLVPEACVRCGLQSLTVEPDLPHLRATCDDCGHSWRTGHLNKA